MHFGENQLSLSLIGLSPLPTAHPPIFQHESVRSSTRPYPRFNLAMDRSLSFGSPPRDWTPYSDSVSLRLQDNPLTLPRSATRRLILQKARRHSPSGCPAGLLRRFVGTRFQVLFHSPPGVL